MHVYSLHWKRKVHNYVKWNVYWPSFDAYMLMGLFKLLIFKCRSVNSTFYDLSYIFAFNIYTFYTDRILR